MLTMTMKSGKINAKRWKANAKTTKRCAITTVGLNNNNKRLNNHKVSDSSWDVGDLWAHGGKESWIYTSVLQRFGQTVPPPVWKGRHFFFRSVGYGNLYRWKTCVLNHCPLLDSRGKGAFTPKAMRFFRPTETHEKSTYRRLWLR